MGGIAAAAPGAPRGGPTCCRCRCRSVLRQTCCEYGVSAALWAVFGASRTPRRGNKVHTGAQCSQRRWSPNKRPPQRPNGRASWARGHDRGASANHKIGKPRRVFSTSFHRSSKNGHNLSSNSRCTFPGPPITTASVDALPPFFFRCWSKRTGSFSLKRRTNYMEICRVGSYARCCCHYHVGSTGLGHA
jgi:hypothetical protein